LTDILERPLTTVVIPARNEERFIAQCLAAVSAQSYEPLEILVVDGASTDRTAVVVQAYARRDPRIRLLHNERGIVPVSLNVASREAAGRWMVRIDAHATVDRTYVERCVEHLETGRWGAVGGRVEPIGLTPTGRAIAAAMCSRFGIGNSVHHYGTEPSETDHVPFPGYPLALVRAIGGWDEELVVNQDFEFDYRLGLAGHKVLYDPALVISYFGQQTIEGVFRQFLRYGRGKARVVLLHPRSTRLRHLVAPGFVAFLAADAAVAPWRPWLAALAVAPYVLALTVASVAAARRLTGARARLAVPAAFVAMHVAWGAGFIRGTLGTPWAAQRRRRATTATTASAATAAPPTTTGVRDEPPEAGAGGAVESACLP
jgi:glycosyltransferase involved in cell wall biosynthesis